MADRIVDICLEGDVPWCYLPGKAGLKLMEISKTRARQDLKKWCA